MLISICHSCVFLKEFFLTISITFPIRIVLSGLHNSVWLRKKTASPVILCQSLISVRAWPEGEELKLGSYHYQLVKAFKSTDVVSFCLDSAFTDQHLALLSRGHLDAMKIPSYDSRHVYSGFALQTRHDHQWIVGYINQRNCWYTSLLVFLIQMFFQLVLGSSFPLHSCL